MDVTLLVLAAVLAAGSALAADPPPARADFSGTWALQRESGDDAGGKMKGEVRSSSAGGGALGAVVDLPLEAFVDASRLVVADDGSTLKITYPSGRQRVFRTDGEERLLDEGDGIARVTVKRKGDRGERIQVVARWSGGRSLRETWELLPDPRRIAVTGKAEGRQSLKFERLYEPATGPPPSPSPAATARPLPAPAAGAAPSAAPAPSAAAGAPTAAAARPGDCTIRPKRGTRPPELAALARLPQEDAARRAAASLAPLTASSVITSDVEVRDGCLVWPIVLRVPEKGGAYEVLIDAGDGKVVASVFESLGKPSGDAPRP